MNELDNRPKASSFGKICKKVWDKLVYFLLFVVYTMIKGWQIWLIMVCLVVAAIFFRQCRDERNSGNKLASLRLEKSTTIDVTPEEIRAIRNIGQWEFLSIETEEMAELYKKNALSVSQLSAIYSGTLRLGVDMAKAPDHWFTTKGDTAVLNLPAVGLLDNHFIDEARTRTFYESGTWTAAERESLYQKARTQMLKRCLTKANLLTARRNSTAHFSQMFFNFGFKFVIIQYGVRSN